uniref:Uncharacterized protein n=1 Tax=Ditylenchus dipsaci TaxID=166011 RepID=A0A915CRU6_9BILA
MGSNSATSTVPNAEVSKKLMVVIGTNVRRSVQADVAAGAKETPATARVKIDAKLVRDLLTEEVDAMDVYQGDQPPRRQITDYGEITQRLVQGKNKSLQFFSSGDGVNREGQYNEKMCKYLTRVGRLIGISIANFQEVLQEDDIQLNVAQENIEPALI